MFGETFIDDVLCQGRRRQLSKFDLLATFTALSARSLAKNYRLHLASVPDKVVLAGGGASNRTLVRWIKVELGQLSSTLQVRTSADLGWPPESVEPAAFAFLAWLRLHGEPGNLPGTTGARHAVLLGQITG